VTSPIIADEVTRGDLIERGYGRQASYRRWWHPAAARRGGPRSAGSVGGTWRPARATLLGFGSLANNGRRTVAITAAAGLAAFLIVAYLY